MSKKIFDCGICGDVVMTKSITSPEQIKSTIDFVRKRITRHNVCRLCGYMVQPEAGNLAADICGLAHLVEMHDIDVLSAEQLPSYDPFFNLQDVEVEEDE